jgi:urea transport system ATP-binding protein
MAILEMRDITVEFSGFVAVAGLNLAVRAGELRCLIGPNGAGKTTALDVICGKNRPASGQVMFDGHDITRMEEHRIARLGVGRKFQVPSVFRQLTVRQNLEVALCRSPGVAGNLFRFGNSGGSAELDKLAELVSLETALERPAGTLSHGQTQWLEIALLVAQDARLILMDEPTAGMTAQETQKTAVLFSRLKGRHTLIVVEHDMAFIKEISDVISVMHQGRLLAEGTVPEIEANEQVRVAYLGSGGISGA